MHAFSNLSFLLSLATPLASFFSVATASHHDAFSKRDHSHRRLTDSGVQKRSFDNARFTWFQDGLGACGTTNVASDFIVAINTYQWNSGSVCNEAITITYNGKTATATIMDECEACPMNGLDFSEGLFDYFASESDGTIYGSWSFGSGVASSSSQATTSYTPTSTPSTPTSTYSPPSTSSTPTPTTTSSSSSTSASRSSSSSSSIASSNSSVYSSSNSASSTSAASTATTTNAAAVDVGTADSSSSLWSANMAIVQLAVFLEDAVAAK